MPLTILSLAVAPALMVLMFAGGFWLGRRRGLFGSRDPDHRPPRENKVRVAESKLPDAAEPAAAQDDPPRRFASDLPAAKLAAECKIMIVDDDPVNIRVVRKHLTVAGYQHIVGVSDSRTVLSKIGKEQPDAVLLDIMMPGISGLEILERIRADEQWAYLPVIMVTALDDEQTRIQALDLGATDFLGKPVNATELVPRVRNALLVKAHHDHLKHYANELERQARQLEAQIAQARTDALTGLANRRALDEELQRRFAECQRAGSPLSVMLLDVDHFKDFNDTHGHRAGDEALRVIAGALRGAMRQMDLVARYGGEEFMVLLPGTAQDGARLVAERTRQDIGKTAFRYDGKDLSVTVSVGVAQLAANEHVSRMLQRADHAMYAAKKAGRNKTYWHDGRGIRPVREESAASRPIQQPNPRSLTPSRQPVAPAPAFSATRAPAPSEIVARWSQQSPDLVALECDPTAFAWHLRQRIAEWKRGGAAFCVLLVRLDPLDRFEKAQSPEDLDGLLRLTNRMLNAAVREMDVIGRFDRACSSALLPRTTLQDGWTVAQRVRESFESASPTLPYAPVEIALSLGVAEVAEGDDPVRLLQRSEAAVAVGESSLAAVNALGAKIGPDLLDAMTF